MRLLFTEQEEADLRQAIYNAETHTSGEIRIFVENECNVDPAYRTVELFRKNKMYKTIHRNAVLIYIAVKSRCFYIYGDQGIHQYMGQEVWDQTILKMRDQFIAGRYLTGLQTAVEDIGEKLKAHFPAQVDDVNELSDDIIYNLHPDNDSDNDNE